MFLSVKTYFILTMIISTSLSNSDYMNLSDHTTVTDTDSFPYIAAILKGGAYLSAGSLISENWVLTDADSFFLIREASRVVRVRLGSINYKKGGYVTPIKKIQIHPYFDDNKPQFDIALIMLARPATMSHRLKPVRLPARSRKVVATHFIVTAWTVHSKPQNKTAQSTAMVQRRQILSVSHLHPSDPEDCSDQLSILGLNSTGTLMCLDPAIGVGSCERNTGGPVVLNGILWGVVSSWKPDDCEVGPSPSFVTIVSPQDVHSWIHATMRGENWWNRNFTTTVKPVTSSGENG